MIFSGPTECSHCHAPRSPLWRRGEKGEVLCNACGLYWRNHGTKRPLNVKRAPSPIQKSESGIKVVPSLPPSSQSNRSEHNSMAKNRLEEVLYHATKLDSSPSRYYEYSKTQKALINTCDAIESMTKAHASSHATPSESLYEPLLPSRSPSPLSLSTNQELLKTSSSLLSSHLPAALSRATLTRELLKMKDACDPISFVDISLIQSSSPASTEECSATTAAISSSSSASASPASASASACSSSSLATSLAGLGLGLGTLSLQEAIGSGYKRKRSPISYMGQAYHIGDTILVKGKQNEHYFGLIRQLYVNEYGQKFFSMAWLVPKKEALHRVADLKMLARSDFDLGSLHQAVESMDCIISILFKAATTSTTASSDSGSCASSSSQQSVDMDAAAISD